VADRQLPQSLALRPTTPPTRDMRTTHPRHAHHPRAAGLPSAESFRPFQWPQEPPSHDRSEPALPGSRSVRTCPLRVVRFQRPRTIGPNPPFLSSRSVRTCPPVAVRPQRLARSVRTRPRGQSIGPVRDQRAGRLWTDHARGGRVRTDRRRWSRLAGSWSGQRTCLTGSGSRCSQCSTAFLRRREGADPSRRTRPRRRTGPIRRP
jgi:hypothetical protein